MKRFNHWLLNLAILSGLIMLTDITFNGYTHSLNPSKAFMMIIFVLMLIDLGIRIRHVQITPKTVRL